jgi:glutathione S-transferase
VSLGEKGEFFEQTYRKALGNDPKSDGKVPILIHGQHCLTESEPVCWYLAETFPSGSTLIPADTFQRARMRLLISNECANLVELFSRPKLKKVTSI